jgi:hypothetical protein
MNEDDEPEDESITSLKKFLTACNDEYTKEGGGIMKKTKEQKRIIKGILKKAKKESGRTAIDVVIWSECGETRNVYYRALDGNLSDEAMLCMFMACLVAAELFDEYCKACGIYIGEEYEFGKIIHDYVSEKDKHYDVLELNERLIEAGQPPLFKEKAA